MSAQTKVEVTRGVFDPGLTNRWTSRTGLERGSLNGWPQRAKSISSESGQWQVKKENLKRRAQAAQDEASQELKADVQEDPAPVPVKVEIAPKKQPVQWVGRKRSDITRDGGFMGYFGRTV